VHGALAVARTCHAAVPLLLAGAALAGGLAWPFWGATALVAALLVVEARLVRPEDLSRIETAFFQVNVGVSIVVLIGMIAALAVGGSG
jgi:4-hydroxybenzoate polyprenyltransferase